jgi:hypothetical protein
MPVEKEMVPGFALLVIAFTIANVIWFRGRYSKAGVIRKYDTLVARTLELRAGPGPHYRATDVTRALLASHVSIEFAPYAYAMFCDRDEFAKAPDCGQLSYDHLRQEIAELT